MVPSVDVDLGYVADILIPGPDSFEMTYGEEACVGAVRLRRPTQHASWLIPPFRPTRGQESSEVVAKKPKAGRLLQTG